MFTPDRYWKQTCRLKNAFTGKPVQMGGTGLPQGVLRIGQLGVPNTRLPSFSKANIPRVASSEMSVFPGTISI